jgi:ssDNA-binding Zn-finger/Zn-ribbon topoisomerase 1
MTGYRKCDYCGADDAKTETMFGATLCTDYPACQRRHADNVEATNQKLAATCRRCADNYEAEMKEIVQ